jgi:diguanylate cyclase (GGDEF)-like protein
MWKRILSDLRVDLGEMEDDYRLFYLRDDIAYTVLYISIAILVVFSMFRLDALLYPDQQHMTFLLFLYRAGYILLSVLLMLALRVTTKVSRYDRFMMVWMLLTIFFLLYFNLTRPANFMNTAFDTIVPLAIYMFLPSRMIYNILLALTFSLGTLYIYYFYKIGMGELAWNNMIIAQLVAHALGLVAGLQIRSHRRKSFKAYIQEKDAREMVAYLANIDPLTKSLTRRQFFQIAEAEFIRFLRYRRPFSMLVLDTDHFKNINDTFGHHAGDLVLRNLSLVVMEQKRAQDTFGRLGGEEFGLLLPETNVQQATVMAERIQKTWEDTTSRVDEHLIRSTVSIGVAEAGAQDQTFEEVLRRADRMMYKAKEAGRNSVAAE